MPDAIAADGERHGAERPDRCHLHDQRHHAEHGLTHLIQYTGQSRSPFAHPRHGNAEQDGKEQHGQDVTLGEGVHDLIGDNVDQKVDDTQVALGVDVARHGRRIDLGGVDIHTLAGRKKVADGQADQHGDGGQRLEIQDCLEPDSADAGTGRQLGNTDHDGQEDDGRDHHSHEAHECITQGLHLHGDVGSVMA